MAISLSAGDIASFTRDGFVLPDYRFPEAEFRVLKSAVDAIVRRNVGKHDRIRQPFLPKRPGFTEGVEGGEKTFPFAIHPDVLDIVEQLIGPDIVLVGSFIIAKPPAEGKRVPWHQDGYYLRVNVQPVEAVTLWLSIDHATRPNGCVRYIKGTKRLGILPHRKEPVFGDEAEVPPFDEADVVDGVLLPGQMVLHDPFVVHGSDANTNGERRVGYGFNYIPAHCHYARSSNSIGKSATEQPAETTTRPIWLVRGRNLNPLNDFSVGHEGLEELDRLVDAERRRAASARAA
jgi:hypothetical protein